MKSAVLREPNTILSVDTPNVYVSEPAQRRLEALRSSVDVRLAALEAALEDPARAEALETLILDLARVACEESQAAAAHACTDTRLEAEMHIAQARAAAQAAVDQEYASSADARRALEEARQQIQRLEHEEDTHLNQAREAFEIDLAKARAAKSELEREASRLERSVDEARNDLTTERALTNNLRQELDRVDVQTRALQQEQSEAAGVRARLDADLVRAREAIAEGQRAHAETQTQLALERNALSELRRSSEKTAEHLTLLGRRESEARNAHEHITAVYDETVADLRRERETVAELKHAQKKLQGQLDTNQSTNAEVGRAQSELQQQLTAEQAAVGDLKRALASMQERVDAERSASANQARAESELRTELDAERSSLADLKRALGDLQSRFDDERAMTAELRRATAQAEARMQSAVDTEHALRAELSEAAAQGHQKSNTSDAEAARAAAAAKHVAALTGDLEAERRLVAELRSTQSENERRWEKERSSQAERIADQLASLTAKLEAEQRISAELRQRQSDFEARVAAERATSAELRQDIARVQERSQTGNQDVHSVREALAHARAEVQGLRDELEAARSRVETVLGERADGERMWQEAESRLKRAVRERDELAARLEDAHVDAHHDSPKGGQAAAVAPKAIPSATPLTVLPHPALKPTHRQQGKPATKPREPEAGWVAVRMAPRYAFSEPLAVQINGAPSQLCDLSVGGCQVLSQAALKPNQTVKVTLPVGPKPISCSGKIVWAKLEAPALGRPAGYRAGVQFSRPDQAALEAFIVSHGASVLV